MVTGGGRCMILRNAAAPTMHHRKPYMRAMLCMGGPRRGAWIRTAPNPRASNVVAFLIEASECMATVYTSCFGETVRVARECAQLSLAHEPPQHEPPSMPKYDAQPLGFIFPYSSEPAACACLTNMQDQRPDANEFHSRRSRTGDSPCRLELI